MSFEKFYEDLYTDYYLKPVFGRLLNEEHLQEMAYFPAKKAVDQFFYWFPSITGVQFEKYWQNIKGIGEERSTTADIKTRKNDIGYKIIPFTPVDADGKTKISWKQWVLSILQDLYLRHVTIEILLGLKNSFKTIFQGEGTEEVQSITVEEIKLKRRSHLGA